MTSSTRHVPPAFEHGDDGTPAEVWREAPQWRDAPRVDLPDHVRRLVVVAAHPDDETLTAGGIVALGARAGLRVDVVVATDGSASHPDSPTHSRAALAALRSREVTEAMARLAPEVGLHRLGLEDGALSDSVDTLTEQLVDLVGRDGDHTLLVSTWLGDGHPDHTAAAQAAGVTAWRTDALLWQAPIWAWVWGAPGDLPWDDAVVVELPEEVRRRKLAAIEHHVSQVQPLSDLPGDEALLTPGFLEHFRRDAELFLVVEPDRSTPFDALHRTEEDPWQVRTSWYEQRKRALSLASLPHPHYDRAVDVGCSLGELTAELAPRCGWLLAVDESEVAVRRAQHHLVAHRGVEVRRLALPEEWPDRTVDLAVVSESGYFLSPARLAELAVRIRRSLAAGGVVLACHWRHDIRGWPLDGPAVHDILHTHLGLRRSVQHEDDDFVLTVWRDDAAGAA